MTYENFKTACKNLGEKHGVFVETKYFDMSNYGLLDWFQASFKTDRFGGIAAIVSYYEDNLWYESSNVGKKIFTRFDEIDEWLDYDIADMRESRHVEMFNCD